MNRTTRRVAWLFRPVLIPVAMIALATPYPTLAVGNGGSFKVKIDDKDFVAEWTSSSTMHMGTADVLHVSGHVGGTFMTFNVSPPAAGTYTLGTGRNSGSYVDAKGETYKINDGVVEITTLNQGGKTVSGKFSGTGKNNDGETIRLIDGEFKGIGVTVVGNGTQ